jgi:putative two-component system response regulator
MTSLDSVLIVDDEPAVRDLMSRWVSALGLRPQTAATADEALETMRRRRYDLAVIDVMMPGRDGLWLVNQLQHEHPHTAVVLATAYSDLCGDAPQPVADFLIKPFQRERFALAVDRGRQWRKQTLEELHWHAMLTIELRDRAAAITATVAERARHGEDEGAVLHGLALDRIVETAAHGERVERYAQSVAREMRIPADAEPSLAIAARFHDIGKIAIPEALLTKPSPLTTGEIAIMRQHVEVGAEILEATATLADAAPIVCASHEWFAGGGYPHHLAGEAIPLASRIIAVVDAYDAMTQDRAYRSRFNAADAVAELLRCSPVQFDPHVVAAFLAVLGRH